MNKSQRIYVNTGLTNSDNHLQFILEQDVDTLEVMSLKLDTKEAYANFNADYGVLVGRVTANGGIGIPNAKVSVFIPLQDEDQYNGDIASVYPYKSPRDLNNYGKRYNLLPRVAKVNPETGDIKPQQPFGSFPIKEEIVTNETQLEVYKKYYKYTTVTNQFGDYMIFGAPIGTQTIHMSCDITDIGKYSMTPAAMVTNLGYSPNLFTDNNTRIKPSNDLGDLPNIETQEITVDIIPFWGDTKNFEIGITQQDFRIRATLVNTFTIFGSAFTDGDNAMWGKDQIAGDNISELYRARDPGNDTVGLYTKRIGEITEKIYYYPPTVSDYDIDNGIADPIDDMMILDPSAYSIYKRDGDFAFIINCNRDKKVTDQNGNEIPVAYDSTSGVFTKFRGFVTLEITSDNIPMNFSGDISGNDNTKVEPYRFKLKFPQYADAGVYFDPPSSNGWNGDTGTELWRKQSTTFEAAKYYSFARFHPTIRNNFDGVPAGNDNPQFNSNGYPNANGFLLKDKLNDPPADERYNLVGIIMTGDYDGHENAQFEFPTNTQDNAGLSAFGSNWLNLSVYLPQLGRMTRGYSDTKWVRTADFFHKQGDGRERDHFKEYNQYFLSNNDQPIAATDFNTKNFARNDLNWTDIIEVPIGDIRIMKDTPLKGFNDSETSEILTGIAENDYRNGYYAANGLSSPCPYNGGRDGGDADDPDEDQRTYFYKGLGDANCIEYLFYLGLVT